MAPLRRSRAAARGAAPACAQDHRAITSRRPDPNPPASAALPPQIHRVPALAAAAPVRRAAVRVAATANVPAVAAAAAPADAEGSFMGIGKFTWQKIIPLGLMFFCILYNYTILRDTKDVLVVTAPGSGAEIIPFLKTWVNLPMAIGFTVLYTKLSNVLSNEQLFYTCIIPFIAFFGAFAFFIYPLRDVLHPTAYCEKLLLEMGPRFAGPIAIVREPIN
jgi:AAA family ATP:ADP antiporter